ncbi:uncharacterized protein KY384_006147 [Bacidia gigantensis]|uniref:uncharacterized protein n=1 Tax=Bacidia gigantensis TaxID=2732470 RepID=UPI001D041EE0|nr:uncharacterized protein KY384_006147 [Bacidia gigantensis]KAG8529510.1 hypothetical protein KY384_006147 [Bacidia gigantensis]
MTSLHADVYLNTGIPVVPPSTIPGGFPSIWTPSTSTLIHSAHEAVLVDPLLTRDEGTALADWIAETIPNKTLKYVYVTHGHGDHYFGITPILARYPNAIPIATQGVLEHLEDQIGADIWANWQTWFPGNQFEKPDLSKIQVFSKNQTKDSYPTFYLDEHPLHVVPVGHGDTDASTVLWSPDLNLVAAGDVVYNGGFQYVAESTTPEKRQEWIHAIEKVRSLKPTSIVTGHKRIGAVDGAWTLDWTQQYLRTWGQKAEEVQKEGGGALEMFWKMKAAFPDNTGYFILWLSSLAQFPPKK